MEEGFLKGQSDNLPRVDRLIVAQYFMKNQDFTAAEIRGIKMKRVVKICLPVLVLYICSTMTAECQNLTASGQLLRYKIATQGQTLILTDATANPVNEMDTVTLNSNIIDNTALLQDLMHFAAERTSDRPVHTKGSGAYGYFEVTQNISDICKAKVFSEVGKQTRVVVRFSNQISALGAPDSKRDTKGFAIKFYTEEGNLDLLGINSPCFNIKDPFYFPSHIHSAKPNPQTGLSDLNSVWDFLTLRPENILFILNLYGDTGIPNGFRHMPGYPIHTYQLYNDQGDISYVRFQFQPDAGVQNIASSEAKRLGAEDPDYFAKDLYEAILNGDYPSWTMSIQYMSPEDVKNSDFNPFDVTLVWPEKQYPPKPIGKLVLNENLKNHFAENILLAFNPANLVSGIKGAGDKLFEARRLTYIEAAHYRLGANVHKIKVNCPIIDAHTYLRDGSPSVKNNEENAPNYFPNSFNGPYPYTDNNTPQLLKHYVDPAPQNFDQARDMYENQLDEGSKSRLIENIVDELISVEGFIKRRAIKMFTLVHPDFGLRVEDAIKNATKSTYKPVPIED